MGRTEQRRAYAAKFRKRAPKVKKRRVERWILGGVMSLVAWVLERRVLKALHSKSTKEAKEELRAVAAEPPEPPEAPAGASPAAPESPAVSAVPTGEVGDQREGQRAPDRT